MNKRMFSETTIGVVQLRTGPIRLQGVRQKTVRGIDYVKADRPRQYGGIKRGG